jgi:hypothetical protein
MLGMAFFMYRTVTNKKLAGICLLLLVLVFFNGQNMETSTWAMVGIANAGILFIAMASMYCLLNTKKNLFYFGLILSVATIFSNGGGMFIIPPVAIGLYLQNRKKTMLSFLGIAMIFVFLFFCDYTKHERISIGLIDIIKNIPVLFSNFLIFIGLNFWIPSYKILSFLAGLFCISVYIGGIRKKWYKNDLLIYAFLTFYFLSAIAASISWLSTGVEGALRYRIYCSPIIILTLFLIINNIRNLPGYIYMLPLFFIVFNLFSTFLYAQKEQKKMEWKMKSAYNWHYKGTGLATFSVSGEENHLREVEKLGWYHMPEYNLSNYASTISSYDYHSTPNNTEDVSYQIESITESGDYLLIEGWGFLNNKSMNFSNIFIGLTNQEQSYIVSTFAEKRYDLKTLDIPLDRIENCGFFAVIDKKSIAPGTYQIVISIKRTFEFNRYYNEKTKENIIIPEA